MIVCDNLHYNYPHSKNGLRDFFFDDSHLPDGVCGLLGKNGAGKSTLIKIIAGVLKPKSGNCTVDGHQPYKRQVSFLQNFAALPEEYEAPDVYVHHYKKHWAPFYPNFDNLYFDNLLKHFDVPQSTKVSTMSFGQIKKFFISFILATQSKLLVLDEPTNGLDIPGKMLFAQIMSKHRVKGQKIIISTHQIKDVESILDALTIVDNGRCLFSASVEDIKKAFVTEKKRSIPKQAKNIIFSVPDVDGYKVLKTNTLQRSVKTLDFEMFFSAAVTQTQEVKQILGKEDHFESV